MPDVFELLFLPFGQRALLAGLAVALVSGVLGVFVVLRGMSFFSDAIAHASLLGIAVALLFAVQPFLGALAVAVITAAAIALLRGRTRLSLDTLIGVFFSAAVALAVILIGFVKGLRADLVSFLFGDILALSPLDVAVAWILSLVVLVVLFAFWRAIVLTTLHRDLAHVEGVPVVKTDLLFLLLTALVVAVAIKVAGVILVTALLIIPAATAQNLARTFLGMVAWSVATALLAVLLGLILSFAGNLPSGPTMVVTAAALFVGSLVTRRR